MRQRCFAIGVALALCASSHVFGQLIVDDDLGALPAGITSVSGDTTGFGSETDYYALTNPAANWGNEKVYQFTTPFDITSISLTLTAATNDPDFFILSSTDVELDGVGKLFAPDNRMNFFLDGGIPANDGDVVLPQGTYFLSATTFAGFDGATTNDQSTYTIDIAVAEITPADPPTDFIDLGTIAKAGSAFTIDTFGSDFDTELGYWDSLGFLLGSNDDAGGTLQSELIIDGLDAGDYYLALGEFNTVFGFGFDATTTAFVGGSYTLNFNQQTTAGKLGGGSIQFFRFTISGTGCDFSLGDVNQDGAVSLLDVDPFVTLLTSQGFQCEADVNEDGAVTLLDVDPFIGLLTGG